MHYFKSCYDEYIICVGMCSGAYYGGGSEIDKEEYDELSALLSNVPQASDEKHVYKLKEDTLEWKLVERDGL